MGVRGGGLQGHVGGGLSWGKLTERVGPGPGSLLCRAHWPSREPERDKICRHLGLYWSHFWQPVKFLRNFTSRPRAIVQPFWQLSSLSAGNLPWRAVGSPFASCQPPDPWQDSDIWKCCSLRNFHYVSPSWSHKAAFKSPHWFKVRLLGGGRKGGLIRRSESSRKFESYTPMWTVVP